MADITGSLSAILMNDSNCSGSSSFLTAWSGVSGLTTSSMDLEFSGGNREQYTVDIGNAIRRTDGELTLHYAALLRNTTRTARRCFFSDVFTTDVQQMEW